MPNILMFSPPTPSTGFEPNQPVTECTVEDLIELASQLSKVREQLVLLQIRLVQYGHAGMQSTPGTPQE